MKDAIEQAAEPQEHAADVLPVGVEPARSPASRLKHRELPPSAGCARAAEAHGVEPGDLIELRDAGPTRSAGRAESAPAMHPEFRTEVTVAEVTVTGVLPVSARPPMGSIAISGDVHRLSCDHALELVDALLLVVTGLVLVLEERYSATTPRPATGRTEVHKP